MKKIMIAFAWTVCVLTACDKNKPSQTEMQALPVDVAKPLVENVTLTKRLSPVIWKRNLL